MNPASRPFFVLEGIDGCGKSTQQSRLVEHLRRGGRAAVACRDPGDTGVGEAIRTLCLEHHGHAIGARTEMLLYMAARAQLVEAVIRPALNAGQVVVSDRFLLSTIAYQGYGRGLDVASIRQVGDVATDRCLPGLTLLLDLPVELAAARRDGPEDRIESRGSEYLERVRQGFLAEAERDPVHIRVIDAARPIDVIACEIATLVDAWFDTLDRGVEGP